MLNLVVCLAASLTAAWKLTQLVRAPHDRGLQVVTMCTVFIAAALAAQYFLGAAANQDATTAAAAKLAQNLLLVWFFCALICFLQSALRPDGLFRWAWPEIGIAGAATAGLLLSFLYGDHRTSWVYASSLDDAAVLTFYLTGNLYMLYACSRGAYLSWSAERRVPLAVSVSLRVAAAGLIVNAVLVHLVRSVSSASRLASPGGLVPAPVDDFSQVALTIGIVLFSVGVAYPGTRTVTIKARLWLRDRRRYLELRPLWEALVRGFPAIALDRPRSRLIERLTVLRMRMRYYRRLIECRDGLLQISPYVREPGTTRGEAYTLQEQAAMVLDALERRNRGELPTGAAVAVAAPATFDIEDDARALLRLSSSIKRELDDGDRYAEDVVRK